MKTVTIILSSESAGFRQAGMKRIQHTLAQLDTDKGYEVIIRNDREGKTKRQLGALFGVWVKWLTENLPAHLLHHYEQIGSGQINNGIHRHMKTLFLAPIYAEIPNGYIQEMWTVRLDELGKLISSDDKQVAIRANNDLTRHYSELSLSWATIEQMRIYMNQIDHYWYSEGYPLPVIEKYQKYYKQSLAKPPESFKEQ